MQLDLFLTKYLKNLPEGLGIFVYYIGDKKTLHFPGFLQLLRPFLLPLLCCSVYFLLSQPFFYRRWIMTSLYPRFWQTLSEWAGTSCLLIGSPSFYAKLAKQKPLWDFVLGIYPFLKNPRILLHCGNKVYPPSVHRVLVLVCWMYFGRELRPFKARTPHKYISLGCLWSAEASGRSVQILTFNLCFTRASFDHHLYGLAKSLRCEVEGL